MTETFTDIRRTTVFVFFVSLPPPPPPVCFMPPVTNYMLLYSTLVCKKKACAPVGHKRFMRTKLGGGRIDPINHYGTIELKLLNPSVLIITCAFFFLFLLLLCCREYLFIFFSFFSLCVEGDMQKLPKIPAINSFIE